MIILYKQLLIINCIYKYRENKHPSPQIITRHYFEFEEYAQNNRSNIKITLNIKNAKKVELPTNPMSDEESARRLRDVQRYLISHSLEMKQDIKTAPSWFSFVPNIFGNPVLFKDEQEGLGGNIYIYNFFIKFIN